MSRRPALVLTPRFPWPLDDGGRIVLWQALRAVARSYDVTLVSLVPAAEADRPLPPAVTELGVRVVRVPHRPPWTPVALLRGAIGRWPYMLERYRVPEMDRTLRRLVAERRPALAFVNLLHMATYRDALAGVPVVLRTHDLVHLWLERYAERLTNPAARAYARAQARRTRRIEAELCAACDLVLAIRAEEAEVFRRLAPGTRVEVMPVGVETGRYLPRAPVRPPVVALIGSWDWPPNVDGARAFLERGWPRVRARVPEARLRLAGKHLPAGLAELGRRAGAEVAGYVDDMAVEFAGAAAMVVPLWMGSGVRVKILEALAAGLPVATTTLGAEGLGLERGVHAAFGDTPEELGEAVAGLLERPAQADRMAAAGRELVRTRFSMDAVTERIGQLCGSVASGDERVSA